MNKKEKKYFQNHLEMASKKVDQWPKWKQHVLKESFCEETDEIETQKKSEEISCLLDNEYRKIFRSWNFRKARATALVAIIKKTR